MHNFYLCLMGIYIMIAYGKSPFLFIFFLFINYLSVRG